MGTRLAPAGEYFLVRCSYFSPQHIQSVKMIPYYAVLFDGAFFIGDQVSLMKRRRFFIDILDAAYIR